MIPTLPWVARASAWAWSRREIHRYALGVMYARRGRATAASGPVGGVVPVLGDWRSWSDEDRAAMDDLEELARQLLPVAIVKGNTEMVDILMPFVTALNHRSVSSVPTR